MKQVIKIAALCLCCTCAGCRQTVPAELQPADFVRYVESGQYLLSSTIRSGIWAYHFQYKPAGYIALKEQEPDHIDRTAVLQKAKSLVRTVWFNVSISVTGSGTDPLKYEARDLNEYNTRLSYFLNRAGKNFHLSYGSKGEMKQVGYYFENIYSIRPEVVAIVGFSIPDATPLEPLTLEYDDGLFNAGILKFNLSAATFRQIPALSI